MLFWTKLPFAVVEIFTLFRLHMFELAAYALKRAYLSVVVVMTVFNVLVLEYIYNMFLVMEHLDNEYG